MATFSGIYAGQTNVLEFTTFKPDDIMRHPIVQGKMSLPSGAAASTSGQPIFRGIIFGQYVYNSPTPPLGAINVIIVGYTT